jgi:hypothetical protein
MTDECFFNELWIVCYKQQIDGYEFGAKQRIGFKPIVAFKKNVDGTYNREGTLEGYSFTEEQRAALLER